MAPTLLAGRYALQHKLGSGGMATVYEAHDELLDRAVAIKLLRSEALSEATARERFAAEARAAASLTHPHAVAVYDVSSGAATDQPFIVMELVRGRTLQDVLDEDRLDEDRIVAVGAQMLTALHAAHRRGLVHRDVKPANILLPDGVVPRRPEELPGVKLADFGIAKATADATVGLTMVGQVIGTPKYLSPEQVKGERATPRSDLYATGVVLYEMFAGRPPFQQDSALGLALAHREDDPPPLNELRPDLNPNLVAVVHRSLSKDPSHRFADANEMREALVAAASAAPREVAGAGGAAAGSAAASSGTQVLDHGAASTQMVGPGGPTVPVDRDRAAWSDEPPAQPARRRTRAFAVWLATLVVLGVVGLLAAQWLMGRFTDTTPTDTVSEAPAGDTDAGGDDTGDQDSDQGDQDEQDQGGAVPGGDAPPDDPQGAPTDPGQGDPGAGSGDEDPAPPPGEGASE